MKPRSVVLAPLFAACVAAFALAQDPQREPPERQPEIPKPADAQQPARPAPPVGSARSIEERRAIAQDAARFEAKYRNALARIHRLTEIYKEKGDEERVLQLERLKDKLAVRREHAMEGFRKELGEAGFQRIRTQLEGGARRALEERAKKSKAPGGAGSGS